MKCLSLALVLTLFTGCSVLEPMPGGRSAAQPTEAQMRLAAVLSSYRLPDRSIAPTLHSNAMVDAAIKAMFRAAERQQLIFDGSRAAEGEVIVGRMGSTAQMLLGLTVYPVGERVGFHDVTNWRMSDLSEGTRMRQRFLSALK